MKKGQMEMMGLAIIVILLTLGLLFVVKFVIFRQPSTATKEYTQSELAANFLNTLMDTNAPSCSNTKFGNLFIDCASHNAAGGNIQCIGSTGAVMGGSCEYLKETIPLILLDTFDKWKIRYRFVAATGSDDLFDSKKVIFDAINSGCEDSSNKKVKIQPLPSDPALNVALFICDSS